MRAIILAAGIGYRLGGGEAQPPKSLLRFDGRSLIARHLDVLADSGVTEVAIGVGYRAETLHAELARLGYGASVRTVYNPDYREGNIVTLWRLREELTRGGDVILMDADVLYDPRIMQRLIGSRHATCFLMDRDLDPGDEPVKLCVRDGRLVEFRKRIDPAVAYDYHGESVGFFRLCEDTALRLAETVDVHIRAGNREEMYEEALRDLLLGETGPGFGFEDITGLAWIEIDFPEDVRRAEQEIMPALRAARADVMRLDRVDAAAG